MGIFSRSHWFIISLVVFCESLFCSTEEICSSVLIFFLFDDISIPNNFTIRFLVCILFSSDSRYDVKYVHPSSTIHYFYNICFWTIKILRLSRLELSYVSNRMSSSSRSEGRTFQMHCRITWNLVIWKLAAFMLIISLLLRVKINETW